MHDWSNDNPDNKETDGDSYTGQTTNNSSVIVNESLHSISRRRRDADHKASRLGAGDKLQAFNDLLI